VGGSGPSKLAIGVVAVVVASLAVVAFAAGGAAASPKKVTLPSGGKHCGLLSSIIEWEDAPHIKGHLYSYGVIHIKKCSEGSLIARRALLHYARPDGFTCDVSPDPVPSGYCYKGNLHKPKMLKVVSWAPETNCAIPDPPYTPATLPSKCHT
jgi:hypothetical protein